ncbi:MAG: peptide chain release factor N(5)-glutamine methyltransferase [Bacteroidales bacterium]|nr:peptide chain release factor N(5)-glutamine methyltransferase [Bacteroidales bacterium]
MLKVANFSASNYLRSIRHRLEVSYDPSEARQLALILIPHYAGISKQKLMAEPEFALKESEIQYIEAALIRLLQHEPIQYITGIAHFCGHNFRVTPDVLIPRPETEELVQWIFDEHANQTNLQICDIGTGSGCIAISLSKRLINSRVDAFDISEKALGVASANSERLGTHVDFFQIDINDQEKWPDKEYDIIVSNPPYIPLQNKHLLPRNVADYEPAFALFVPNDDPLLFYRAIVAFAALRLKKNGLLYVEVHEDYADAVVELFAGSGLLSVTLRCDINGKKRMISGRK